MRGETKAVNLLWTGGWDFTTLHLERLETPWNDSEKSRKIPIVVWRQSPYIIGSSRPKLAGIEMTGSIMGNAKLFKVKRILTANIPLTWISLGTKISTVINNCSAVIS